jgi:hypothetical protein
MCDVALRVSFHFELTAEQFAEILACASRAETKAELTAEITILSKR